MRRWPKLAGDLLEQPQHVLVGLRGERQRRGRELLAGLQGEQVGALFVESASVRLSAPVCSVLIIALVKSWRICTVDRFELERLRLRAQRRQRGGQVGRGRGDVGGAGPVVGRGVDRQGAAGRCR